MPPEPASGTLAADVDGWLEDLGIRPLERVEREAITSWDLRLDGRRRFDVRATLILDPALAAIVWVHYAPSINDAFRASYRKLLRWNDEYPFVKFALAEDGRPVLSAELPLRTLDRDELGLAIARLLAICDQLLDESVEWIWAGGRPPEQAERVSRQLGLFARYADRLGDLAS
ncbi:MAG: YbjN domain-containing protein [Candidatus Limnocylindrales bacterium]